MARFASEESLIKSAGVFNSFGKGIKNTASNFQTGLTGSRARAMIADIPEELRSVEKLPEGFARKEMAVREAATKAHRVATEAHAEKNWYNPMSGVKPEPMPKPPDYVYLPKDVGKIKAEAYSKELDRITKTRTATGATAILGAGVVGAGSRSPVDLNSNFEDNLKKIDFNKK